MEPQKLITKYKVSEKDLYLLGLIENKKTTAGFFEKDKLRKKALAILKPYNVKFIELGLLLVEIKNQNYHSDTYLVNKYGEIDLASLASSYGMKYFFGIFITVFLSYFIISFAIDKINGPTACDCANLYENSPWKKNYSAEEMNDGETLRKDADEYVDKAKDCAIKYGGLDEFEKEMAKSTLQMDMIPGLDRAVKNASQKCK